MSISCVCNQFEIMNIVDITIRTTRLLFECLHMVEPEKKDYRSE